MYENSTTKKSFLEMGENRRTPDIDATNRSRDGRLFVLRPPEYYEELFEKPGFTHMKTISEEDGLGRAGYRWLTMIFEKDLE